MIFDEQVRPPAVELPYPYLRMGARELLPVCGIRRKNWAHCTLQDSLPVRADLAYSSCSLDENGNQGSAMEIQTRRNRHRIFVKTISSDGTGQTSPPS
jgi:hypothetical protein